MEQKKIVWSKIYFHQNSTFASIMYQYSKNVSFGAKRIAIVAKKGLPTKLIKLAGDLTEDLAGDMVLKNIYYGSKKLSLWKHHRRLAGEKIVHM
jgi:hypothetical protein